MGTNQNKKGAEKLISTPFCGGGGIRTPDTRKGMLVFKTSAFNRSATPPFVLLL